jgi:ribosomal protein L17
VPFASPDPTAPNRRLSSNWPQMAGGTVKYRHLSRNSSARQALLRGLVTQLVQYEHIQTTYAKAKETQRLAEKLITLAKRNNEPCRRSAQGILYVSWDPMHSRPPPSSQLLIFRASRPRTCFCRSSLANCETAILRAREATPASSAPSPRTHTTRARAPSSSSSTGRRTRGS